MHGSISRDSVSRVFYYPIYCFVYYGAGILLLLNSFSSVEVSIMLGSALASELTHANDDWCAA